MLEQHAPPPECLPNAARDQVALALSIARSEWLQKRDRVELRRALLALLLTLDQS